MIKAIADRLAEAFAEKLHQMIRVDFGVIQARRFRNKKSNQRRI